MLHKIHPYLVAPNDVTESNGILLAPVYIASEALHANAYYFGNKAWVDEYFKDSHRNQSFKSRWQAAVVDCTDKIIIDIGCGPGNVFATLGGKPALLIGVDVAVTSLLMAKKAGYTPLLADATALPFISGFADIVTLNAALHHCEDMPAMLEEAARLVKPGGLLITDHDPQLSAWDYKGLAKLMWKLRLKLYKYMRKGFHKSDHQQYWALASTIHHKPGHGVTRELFEDVLIKRGFSVKIFPHNHQVGSEIFQGKIGRAKFKFQLANLLSGRNPNAATSALSLMCVAQKSL